MKIVDVSASFPEVIVNEYAFETTKSASASTFKAAVSRALGSILKSPELKRKRFTTVSLSIVVGKEVE